ncbi:DNA polymerase III subunit delta [Candidatus Neomarinimicrobiota bacterium]
MAEITYTDAIRQVMSDVIQPVYLLAGGDPFYEDFFAKEVAKRFLPAEGNKVIYSLDDDLADTVLAELGAYHLFQTRQMAVIRQVQRISGAARDELMAYIQKPNPDRCVILVIEEYQPKKGIQKGIGQMIPIIDARPPFPDKLCSWANYYAKLKDFTIQPDALDLLVDFAGDSAGHLISELEKIFSSLKDTQTVTREIVEDQVVPAKSFQLWHLQEAVADRNTENVLRITASLVENGMPSTRIINALATLFCQLLFVYTSSTSYGVYTGLNSPVTAKLKKMMKIYTFREIEYIIPLLLSKDRELKTTGVKEEPVIIGLVASICSGIT